MILIQALQKWGNSAGVRLPKQVLQDAHLSLDQKLSVRVEKGSVILTPLEDPQEKGLKALLKGVSPEMIGGEFDFGLDVGAEQYE